MPNFFISQVDYSRQESAIRHIRERVFLQEQGIDRKLEFDGRDDRAVHLLATVEGQPAGTARIRTLNGDEAKIERLAVLPEYRRQGIARALMATALEAIAATGRRRAIVHAQIAVAPLYVQLGFRRLGSPFSEAGISHIKMVKLLRE